MMLDRLSRGGDRPVGETIVLAVMLTLLFGERSRKLRKLPRFWWWSWLSPRESYNNVC